jgi:hypothetical protein
VFFESLPPTLLIQFSVACARRDTGTAGDAKGTKQVSRRNDPARRPEKRVAREPILSPAA